MKERLRRLAIVVAGIVLTQAILYGPSLLGRKVLLPVDLLALEGAYLPQTAETRDLIPHDSVLSDLIYSSEPARQFACTELRQGRLPIWSPYEYCGSPSYRHPLSPAWALNYLIASPVVLAWSQVLLSIFAGLGAYAFFRRCLPVGFWPAALVAWCFPISGTFILWQGGGSPPVVACLPWLLLCVDQTLRRPASWGGPALAVLTFITLVSGAPDIAGQVLLVSGLFALWVHVDQHRARWFRPQPARAFLGLLFGWGLGILLSLPALLPLAEYTRTGARIISRSHGSEERPPVGLAELPQVVLPEMYGTSQKGSLRLVPSYQPESSAGAYAGLLATLVAAPLAWLHQRRRSQTGFWLALSLLGLAWPLNVPGLVQVMRLPGMNLMSFNRFVFVTAFALLALAALGLEALWQGARPRLRWSWLPLGVLIALLGWCLYHTLHPPEPTAAQFAQALQRGQILHLENEGTLVEIRNTYSKSYGTATALSALGIGAWILLTARRGTAVWIGPALGAVMVAELLWFGYGRNSQSDPLLYFPRIPMLEEIAHAPPGRIIGYNCLQPNLSRTHGLRDVRGYDAVDPLRLVQLLACTATPQSLVFSAAATQFLTPKIQLARPAAIHLHPVLDLLGVRYVIFRGKPPEGLHPTFSGDDYWALTNPAALPRVFIPQRVTTVSDTRERLTKLADERFSPRELAYVEEPVSLPESCEGTARIEHEIPRRISVSVEMKTPGLVVLTDLWDQSWRAFLDEREVPILVANHAVRGVLVPRGESRVEFRHEPESLPLGLNLAAAGAVLWIGWIALARARAARARTSDRRV